MSKYMIDKLLRHVEMGNERVAAYVADPEAFTRAWVQGGTGTAAGAPDDRVLTDAELRAFATRDYGALYALGAHPYLLWHFTEAVYEGEYRDGFGWRELVEQYRAAVAPQGVVDYVP